MKIIIINTLVTIENVICVYRNYYLLKRSVAKIVKLRIFFELCIIILCALVRLIWNDIYKSDVAQFIPICYLLQTIINTIGAIMISCYNTEHFKKFVLNIEAVHMIFKNNITYQNSRKTQCKRFYFDVLLFFAIVTPLFAYCVYDSSNVFVNKFIILLVIIEVSLEFRFCYEYFVFSEFIKLIIAPLKFLNEVVLVTVEKLRRGCGEAEYDDELFEIQRELEKWGEASQLLGAASDRLSDCCGPQIAVSCLAATFYYMILLYQCISLFIQKKFLSHGFGLGSSFYALITYVWLLLLLLVSGQRVQSEAEQLNRNLVVLHSLLLASSEDGACARDAAALARRLRAAPLRVRLFSSVKVQMTLLTGMLAFVVNYTIVLLQFNHVV